MAEYHTHISAKHKWLELNLKEVWQYRDLIYLFTKRNFVVSYKPTILGPAWLFLTPLLSSVVQAFVFGGIAGISTEGVPTYLFGKVYFPRLVTPISNVISTIIRFFIQMIMVCLFLGYFLVQGAVHPHWAAWLMIPVELVHLGILGMGCGIIISSMTTKYRDLTVLVEFGVQLWMYLTPIVYPLSTAAEGWMRMGLLLNPVTSSVELMRYAILGQGSLHWGFYGLSWIVTIAVAVLGIMIFNRVERTFMDTV